MEGLSKIREEGGAFDLAVTVLVVVIEHRTELVRLTTTVDSVIIIKVETKLPLRKSCIARRIEVCPNPVMIRSS